MIMRETVCWYQIQKLSVQLLAHRQPVARQGISARNSSTGNQTAVQIPV
jgi:hypothetical protein